MPIRQLGDTVEAPSILLLSCAIRARASLPDESAWSAVQIAAEKKRRAEEGEARARQQQERRAAEDAEDRAAAQQRATELRNAVAYHREGQHLGRH